MPFSALRTLILLILALTFGESPGQDVLLPQATESMTDALPETAAVSREQLLRADGALDLQSGHRGGVSMAGWRMATGVDGAPRFEREDGKTGEPGGDAWSPLSMTSVPADSSWDSRFATPGANDEVFALAMDGSGSLYAGGKFTTAGGVSANGVAMWNGLNWSPLGSGMNSYVDALAVDGGGCLYAGGAFTTAGDKPSGYFGSWQIPTFVIIATAGPGAALAQRGS